MKRDYFIHLYRNKWLRVKPEKLSSSYYPGEPDKDDSPIADYGYTFHEIEISATCPGVLLQTHRPDVSYIPNNAKIAT